MWTINNKKVQSQFIQNTNRNRKVVQHSLKIWSIELMSCTWYLLWQYSGHLVDRYVNPLQNYFVVSKTYPHPQGLQSSFEDCQWSLFLYLGASTEKKHHAYGSWWVKSSNANVLQGTQYNTGFDNCLQVGGGWSASAFLIVCKPLQEASWGGITMGYCRRAWEDYKQV